MLRDLLTEAVSAVRGRLGRTWLTALGVAVGIMALTATVSVTATASAQVSSRFDALQATSVALSGPSREELRGQLSRLDQVNGVIAYGLVSQAAGDKLQVSRIAGLSQTIGRDVTVTAISLGAQSALSVSADQGRLFDEGMRERQDPVALVGNLIAPDLVGQGIDGNSTITVAGEEFLVAGVVSSSDPSLDLSVVLPDWIMDGASAIAFKDPTVVIHTRTGAAQQVGVEARYAINPSDPDAVAASVPPDPRQLREDVESDTQNLFLALAFVSLLVGGLGVSNTMLVAVMERRFEIGVRRALGATGALIMAQIILEGALLGGIGGLAGTLAGVNLNFGVALVKGWTAVLPPWVLLGSPLLGTLMGLIAGIYPAARAVAVEPVAALSR